jgi:hypothetical protein
MNYANVPIVVGFLISGPALVVGLTFGIPVFVQFGVFLGWLATVTAVIVFVVFLGILLSRIFSGGAVAFLKRSYLACVNFILALAGAWWITDGHLV